MPFRREVGRLESECLTIFTYLFDIQSRGEPYQLTSMARALDWTVERVLNYLHPSRWKTISVKQLENWRDFHWKKRGARYRYAFSLYRFVLDTLRRRPDGKWEYNRSKLPIIRHYATKYGYGLHVRDSGSGLLVEIYKICGVSELDTMRTTLQHYYAAIDPREFEEALDEEDHGPTMDDPSVAPPTGRLPTPEPLWRVNRSNSKESGGHG